MAQPSYRFSVSKREAVLTIREVGIGKRGTPGPGSQYLPINIATNFHNFRN